MDSSVSSKDEIWFLCVCHHFSTYLYQLTRKQNTDHNRNLQHYCSTLFALSTEQNLSAETNNPSPSQTSCTLWSLKVHCHVHNSSQPVSTQRQINPVHILPPSFFKIYFYILPSMPKVFRVVSLL